MVGRTTDRSAQELIQCLINILYIRIISGRSVILLIEKEMKMPRLVDLKSNE